QRWLRSSVPVRHRLRTTEHVRNAYVNHVKAFPEEGDIRRGLVPEESSVPNPGLARRRLTRRDNKHRFAITSEWYRSNPFHELFLPGNGAAKARILPSSSTA